MCDFASLWFNIVNTKGQQLGGEGGGGGGGGGAFKHILCAGAHVYLPGTTWELVMYFCVHNCTSPSNDYAAVGCSNNNQAQLYSSPDVSRVFPLKYSNTHTIV